LFGIWSLVFGICLYFGLCVCIALNAEKKLPLAL